MPRTYLRWLPIGLVLAAIGLIIGLTIHTKNSIQVQECGTKLNEIRQLVSPSFRATCTTAKSMAGLGTAVTAICGGIAVIILIVGIVHFMTVYRDSVKDSR